MVGMELDLQSAQPAAALSSASSTAFRSRVLNNVDSPHVVLMAPPSATGLDKPASAESKETDKSALVPKAQSSDSLSSMALSALRSAVGAVTPANKTPVHIKLMDEKSQSLSAAASKALRLPSPSSAMDTSDADPLSKAVDLYRAPEEQKSADPFAAYKKVLEANVTLDADKTYMWCPTTVQFRPALSPDGERTATINVTKNTEPVSEARRNLARAGLLPQNATHTASASAFLDFDESRHVLSPKNNRVLLWVPTASIVAGGGWDTVLSQEPQAGFKFSGLTEIACEISAIRPVLIKTV